MKGVCVKKTIMGMKVNNEVVDMDVVNICLLNDGWTMGTTSSRNSKMEVRS